MADLNGSCVLPDLVAKLRLTTSSEKVADRTSQSLYSYFGPEAGEVDADQLQQVSRFHGVVSEKPRKLISCGNKSSGNACIEQEVSRYHTCNRVTILQGDENDPNPTRNNDRCSMPEHLLFDILLWLPVISLLRFKSVCKSWCALINSSTFVTQHFSHNCNENYLLGRINYPDRYYFEFCLLSGNKYEMYSNVNYASGWFRDPTLIDSCNGIVCLGIQNNTHAALWNPATRQLRCLPELSMDSRHTFSYFGFGFDVKRNDYKVVRFPFESDLIEIYSLRSDSWKTIQGVRPIKGICSWITRNKNGRCFWIGYDDQDSFLLVSFDLNVEVFEAMALPGEPSLYDALDFFGGKLVYINCLEHHSPSNLHQYFEIWVLDEHDGKKSWNKLCKLGPTCDGYERRYPYVFSKNGEFLLHGSDVYGGELHLYDFVARENGKYVENKIQNPNPCLSRFVHYNRSLVSI